jgi:chondroitin 4-sulfotransferase 11
MCSINHDKKCVFIHIPKTAGIYVRSVLSKNYDFNLYLFQRPDHKEYCETNTDLEYNEKQDLYFANKIHGIINYYKTSEYLNKLMDMDDEKWDSYYKFCFVRDPYDKFVSGWNYVQETHKMNIDFDVFIKYETILSEDEYFHTFLPQNVHIMNEKNEVYVNKICKFENLENDLEEVLIHIGFSKEEICHDKNKKPNKRKHEHYKKYYNNETLNVINTKFKKDFELLDYKKYDNIDDFTST